MARLIVSNFLSLLFLFSMPLQTPVPVAKEPRHRVVFQNEFVRVIDASVPVGDATLFHIHSNDNVPVAISGGDIKTETVGKDPIFSKVETGAVSFAKAAYTHRISNVGTTPLRFIDAEILASPGKQTSKAPMAGVGKDAPLIDNERVRVYRLILEPGQSANVNTHKQCWLSVIVRGGQMASAPHGKATTVEDVRPGDFRWHTGEVSQSLTNAGPTPLEIVNIELK